MAKSKKNSSTPKKKSAQKSSSTSKKKKEPAKIGKGIVANQPQKRGRKKTTRPAKRKKGFVSTAPTVPATPKRTNRYILITKSIRDYCLRRYGIKCPNEDVIAIYNQLKSRYQKDWEKKDKSIKKKFVTPADIANNIDAYLANKDLIDAQPPLDLQQVWWFEIEGKFQQRDNLFFKPDDDFVLDFSSVNMGVHKIKFKELPSFYRNNLYATMRVLIEEVEAQLQRDLSPPPSLVYDAKNSDVKGRLFYYELDPSDMNGYFNPTIDRTEKMGDTLITDDDDKEVETKIEEQSTKDKTGKTKNVTNKEQKLRERELKIQEDKLTQEELATDMKLVDYELMTKKEFRDKWSEYMKRKK